MVIAKKLINLCAENIKIKRPRWFFKQYRCGNKDPNNIIEFEDRVSRSVLRYEDGKEILPDPIISYVQYYHINAIIYRARGII